MEVNVYNTSKLSPRAVEDFELVQQAISGDQKAYATLMDRYRQTVYHAMFRMVNHREDANDLTLEAFGKAFRKLPTYTPSYAFSTWLFKIAVNNCIDHIRRKRLKLLSIDEPLEAISDRNLSYNLSSAQANPEEAVIRQQGVEKVSQIIKTLNKKYRLMIELRYFEELSYEEIAEELNIPLGTVKAQLHRAKDMLHKIIKQPGMSAYVDFGRA